MVGKKYENEFYCNRHVRILYMYILGMLYYTSVLPTLKRQLKKNIVFIVKIWWNFSKFWSNFCFCKTWQWDTTLDCTARRALRVRMIKNKTFLAWKLPHTVWCAHHRYGGPIQCFYCRTKRKQFFSSSFCKPYINREAFPTFEHLYCPQQRHQ